MNYKQSSETPTEIVMGIIGPIGCNRDLVIDSVTKITKHFSYRVEIIKISLLITAYKNLEVDETDQFARVTKGMDAGNEIRKSFDDNSILAKMAAIEISKRRKTQVDSRVIYIIDSLKRPEEVDILRDIYRNGFYLFAVHSEEDNRNEYLRNHCHISDPEKRKLLIERDKDDKLGHGQSTSAAFHLADFFLSEQGDAKKIWNSLERYLDLIFGHPFRTPTFQEYSMFMAQAASLKSADLSRQVGAVITQDTDIISSGANECPKAFGGTYWPEFDENTNEIKDEPNGRDYMRGMDYNAKEKASIIEALKNGLFKNSLKTLEENISRSGIEDITEYGRVVHAEMDAILGCSRRGVSAKDGVMYCTTHPCHNCAKHIVASGINKVIYIEPYPKSKALVMHDDAITVENSLKRSCVKFEPFIGVGPRQYLNLFSMNLSDGKKMKRKAPGRFQKFNWSRDAATPRIKNFPYSYNEIEKYIESEIAGFSKPKTG